MLDLLNILWPYVTPGTCLLALVVLLLLGMLAGLNPHEGPLPTVEDDPVLPTRRNAREKDPL